MTKVARWNRSPTVRPPELVTLSIAATKSFNDFRGNVIGNDEIVGVAVGKDIDSIDVGRY